MDPGPSLCVHLLHAAWQRLGCISRRIARYRVAARVSRYRFGTRTAEFLICAACGIVPIATSRVENWLHAVVNVNTFEGVDPALLRHAAADFHDEAPAFRLARRQRNWIGRVRFVAR
jgi:hypothetical protein